MLSLKSSFLHSLLSLIMLLSFIFASCGGAAGKTHSSIDAVTKYLSTVQGGSSADNPAPLAVKIDLQNTTEDASGWKQLLNAIDTAGKYVALDLSACTLPNTEFNPDHSFAGGKEFIVSLVLPDTAESIMPGREKSPTFQHFVNLTKTPAGKSLGSAIANYTFTAIGLTSIIITDSVTEIGKFAFFGNQLTSVTIPDSVTEIGIMAFSNNELASVTIPGSITGIGAGVFAYNQLTSITIGANVTLVSVSLPSFDNGFEAAYNNGGRLAGTYTRPDTSSRTWTRQ